jgi:ATP-dependent Clp protease, protease subunit
MPIGNAGGSWPPWPPEIPPLRPPVRPPEPPARPPVPPPLIPSWEEPDPRSVSKELADRLLDQRVILLGGRLDDTSANRAAAQLLVLNRRNSRSPIELHLACTDAELSASLALADAVDLVAAPVHAVVRGTLAGPAVAVLCSAQERAAHRHAVLVLSLPPTSAEGTAGQLAVLAEQHDRQVARLRELIAATTGRSAEDVGADLSTGRVLSGQEALDYGLLNRLL